MFVKSNALISESIGPNWKFLSLLEILVVDKKSCKNEGKSSRYYLDGENFSIWELKIQLKGLKQSPRQHMSIF